MQRPFAPTLLHSPHMGFRLGRVPGMMMSTSDADHAALCVQSMLLTGFLARTIPFFRDRILADKMFLFKVGVEIVIDSGEARP